MHVVHMEGFEKEPVKEFEAVAKYNQLTSKVRYACKDIVRACESSGREVVRSLGETALYQVYSEYV